MRNMLKATTLERKFPLLAVENGCIVSKDGDITVAFRVELPELFTVTRAEYEAIHSAWYKAVKVLPGYSIVHKQDFFITENYQPDTEKDGLSFLSVPEPLLLPVPDQDDQGEKPPTKRLLHALPGQDCPAGNHRQGSGNKIHRGGRAVRAHHKRQRFHHACPADRTGNHRAGRTGGHHREILLALSDRYHLIEGHRAVPGGNAHRR